MDAEGSKQITRTLNHDAVRGLEKSKDLLSHSHPNAIRAELMAYVIERLVPILEKEKGRAGGKVGRIGAQPKAEVHRKAGEAVSPTDQLNLQEEKNEGRQKKTKTNTFGGLPPQRRQRYSTGSSATPKCILPPESGSPRRLAIPRNIKRLVFKKYQGRCEYMGSTG